MTEETAIRPNTLPRGTDPPATPAVVQVIEPPRGWVGVNWREIWRYRELLYFLTWRDVKVRYKQTALGAAWAILQPLLTMIVFSLFFGRLAGLGQKTGGVPYPIYVYVGLLPWTFFANAVTSSGASLVGSSNLITKVYFPRLIIPLAAVAAGLIDLLVSLMVLLALMLYYHTTLSWDLALAPAFLLGTVLTSVGVGTLLSTLTVAYRDFRHAVPFMIQIWMFLTPVIYPSSVVPHRWQPIYALNPMAGVIEGFRLAFLARQLRWEHLGISLGVSLIIFFAGTAYFRTVERRFADII